MSHISPTVPYITISNYQLLLYILGAQSILFINSSLVFQYFQREKNKLDGTKIILKNMFKIAIICHPNPQAPPPLSIHNTQYAVIVMPYHLKLYCNLFFTDLAFREHSSRLIITAVILHSGPAIIKMATEATNARSAKWPPRQVQTYLVNALSLGTLQNTVCIHRPHPKENIYMAPGHASAAMNYSHPSRRLKATSRARSVLGRDRVAAYTNTIHKI